MSVTDFAGKLLVKVVSFIVESYKDDGTMPTTERNQRKRSVLIVSSILVVVMIIALAVSGYGAIYLKKMTGSKEAVLAAQLKRRHT